MNLELSFCYVSSLEYFHLQLLAKSFWKGNIFWQTSDLTWQSRIILNPKWVMASLAPLVTWTHSLYTSTVSSYLLLFCENFLFLSWQVWSRHQVHCLCCPGQTPHKLDQQSRQQELRAYCPNIYNVLGPSHCIAREH